MRAIWALIVVVVVWPLMALAVMLNDWQCCLAEWCEKLDRCRRKIRGRK
jgi:hypothetical protein